MKAGIRKIDPQGRITLPSAWRKSKNVKEVLIIETDDKLEIIPANADLSKYIDSVEVDAKDWDDYHRLRKELRRL